MILFISLGPVLDRATCRQPTPQHTLQKWPRLQKDEQFTFFSNIVAMSWDLEIFVNLGEMFIIPIDLAPDGIPFGAKSIGNG